MHSTRRYGRTAFLMRRASRLTLALLVMAPPGVGWAQDPDGAEFRINVNTTAAALRSAVAADANGDFIVFWQGYEQDGSGSGVFGRRFDASGAPKGPEFRANSHTTGNQARPALALDPSGSFVVVWESEGQDGSDDGVFGQRFDASGTRQGPEFQVNTFTTGAQRFSAVAAGAGGGFVVVWQSEGQDGDSYGVFGQRFDAAGDPEGPEFRVNAFTTGFQARPAAAADASGNVIVVWTNDFDAISGLRLDASGTPSEEFHVNSYTAASQSYSAVAAAASGRFVVAWQSYNTDGSHYGVFARRFDASGMPEGEDFRVNSHTTLVQGSPSVALDADGRFVVAWESFPQDGGSMGIFAQRFDPLGSPRGSEVRVNSFTTSTQRYPAVAANPDGDFVITWSGYGLGGYNWGVFGQRYGDLIFQDNFESGDVGRWSSAVIDGGDLGVAGSAALAATSFGLQAAVDDTAPLFVQDDRPGDERHYRARFYFDPNGFDPGEAGGRHRVRLFIAFNGSSQRLCTLVLRRLGGAYGVQARARLDDGSRVDTDFFGITDAPHFVEVEWGRSSGPGANDGWLALRVDGLLSATHPGLDNDLSGVDSARLGALAVKAGAAGTLIFDQFESRRLGLIGPERPTT